jgi:hypothetical protein
MAADHVVRPGQGLVAAITRSPVVTAMPRDISGAHSAAGRRIAVARDALVLTRSVFRQRLYERRRGFDRLVTIE